MSFFNLTPSSFGKTASPPPLSMPVLSEAEGWRGDEESAH